MIDMHVHLEYADYTFEWIDKFVNQAVKMGIDTLCLVEHTHQFKDFAPMYTEIVKYSDLQYNWYGKKTLRALKEYTDFITAVRKREYPISLLFGLEVCYFKNMEKLIDEKIHLFDFDHIIGSVHWVDNFGFDLSAAAWENVNTDDVFRGHFAVMEDLIRSELFDAVGHPDSVKIFGHTPSYDMVPTYNRIARLMREHGISAEQNGGLHIKDPNTELGLASDFLKAIKANGVNIITASDAHHPEDVGRNIKELLATV